MEWLPSSNGKRWSCRRIHTYNHWSIRAHFCAGHQYYMKTLLVKHIINFSSNCAQTKINGSASPPSFLYGMVYVKMYRYRDVSMKWTSTTSGNRFTYIHIFCWTSNYHSFAMLQIGFSFLIDDRVIFHFTDLLWLNHFPIQPIDILQRSVSIKLMGSNDLAVGSQEEFFSWLKVKPLQLR